MTQSKMSIGSVSLNNKGLSPQGTVPKGMLLDQERMLKYKRFAEFFSYPQDEDLRLEYDRLFRQGELWLYGSEYKIENEFQRAQDLADINGFYRAFALETDKERPDSLICELEFMHCLIFKMLKASDKEKVEICLKAQKNFFSTHLYPAAEKIAGKVIALTQSDFYKAVAQDLIGFLESEKKVFKIKLNA